MRHAPLALSFTTIALACGSSVQTETPPTSGAEAETADDLRLCSWNIRKLGHGSSKNYAVVAEILDDECDAAVLVEVMQKGGTHPGYEELMLTLGDEWSGLVTDSPRPNTASGNAEFYAVIWRDGHLEPCEGWSGLRYATDNDGTESDTSDDLFSREPAYGCFRAARDAGEFDFLLAAYHAVWANGSISTIRGEAAHIDAVVEEMKDTRPGENDILFLGDFNLVPSQLADVTRMTVWTSGEGSTLNSSGNVTGNLYDQLLVDDLTATPEINAEAQVLDVTNRVDSGETFYGTVSDHLPIRVGLTTAGPDDD